MFRLLTAYPAGACRIVLVIFVVHVHATDLNLKVAYPLDWVSCSLQCLGEHGSAQLVVDC
jgi:hypothetical protein